GDDAGLLLADGEVGDKTDVAVVDMAVGEEVDQVADGLYAHLREAGLEGRLHALDYRHGRFEAIRGCCLPSDGRIDGSGDGKRVLPSSRSAASGSGFGGS